MATALTVLVVGLILLQSQTHCSGGRKKPKFSLDTDSLSRNKNGEKLTDHGRTALEDLKQDIVEACRSGELDEVKGYMGRSGELNIPTKVYYLPHDTGDEVTHFLLPAVVCLRSPGKQEDLQTGVDRRTEILHPERKKPLFVPRAQVVEPTLLQSKSGSGRSKSWSKSSLRLDFLSRSRNSKKLGEHGWNALEDLKQDIVDACRSGELDEVKGYMDRPGELNIPTKVYYLPRDTGDEITHFILPAVNCEQSPDKKGDYQKGGNRRTETLHPERKKPLFVPRAQTLAGSQAQTSEQTEFPNRLSGTSKNDMENVGSFMSGGNKVPENRKEDKTQDSTDGGLRVDRSTASGDKKGQLGNVQIQTNAYTRTPDTERVVLPAISSQQKVVKVEMKVGEKEDSTKLNEEDRMKLYKINYGRENGNYMNSNPSRDTQQNEEVKQEPTLMKETDFLGNTNHEIKPSYVINTAVDNFSQIRQTDLDLKSRPEDVANIPAPVSCSQANVLQALTDRREPQNQDDTVVHESIDNTRLKHAEEIGNTKEREDVMKSSSSGRKDSNTNDYERESRRQENIDSTARFSTLQDKESKSAVGSTPTRTEKDKDPVQPFDVDSAASSFINKFREKINSKQSEE